MRSIHFSDDDLSAIAHERYFHPDPNVQRKMEVLWLKHHGLTHQDIARLAAVSRSSVQRYLTEFLDGGLEQVRRCPWTGQRSVLDNHRAPWRTTSGNTHPARYGKLKNAFDNARVSAAA